MRIGIIAASNLRYSPYIWFYTSILDHMEGVDYELVYPNRHGVQDAFSGTAHELPWNSSVPTALGYVLYSRQVIRVIRERKFDALIILTTNNAVFLGSWLRRHYAGRYMVDIRDYTHENIPPFFYLEKKALEGSSLNVISSDRFRAFLPEGEYSVCHNLPKELDAPAQPPRVFGPQDSVTIGYLGTGGYMDNCLALARLVLRDSRFHLRLYGPQLLETALPEEVFTQSQGRIQYCGSFTPDQKAQVISGVDVLFNIYGNGIPLLDYALSNKLYDALCFRKPILTSPDTYMTEYAGPLAFSMELKQEKDLQRLHSFLEDLDQEQVERYASQTLERIVREQAATRQRIQNQISLFKEARKES